MNAMTTLAHGLTHHDYPMIERAAKELQRSHDAVVSENDHLHRRNREQAMTITGLHTELDICREYMDRPITLIVLPRIWQQIVSMPANTSDAIGMVLRWLDEQVAKLPDSITVSTRVAVGMAALMFVVWAGLLAGFEALAGN
ncbi:hypothetical protein [Acetobacter sp.]|uniref:hypothetical protein n=1 Tax=Acetobacter sp. TaxID=440 RepID=UPI0039EB786E